MRKEEKKNEIQILLLTVRVVSLLSLFELIFFSFYGISKLLSTSYIHLIESLNNPDPTRWYMTFLPYILGMFVLYVGGVFVNYFLIKNNSKYAKKILIGEIVLLIIIMTGLFILAYNIF